MGRWDMHARWDAGMGLLLVSIWLLGWFWPALARSEPPPAAPSQQVVARMISLMRQAQALQDEGKDAEAIPLVEQAVALGTQELGPEALPLTIPLERLSELYRTHGDPARAAQLSQRVLAIRAHQQVVERMLANCAHRAKKVKRAP